METGNTPQDNETQSLINRTDFQSQIKFIEYIIDNMKSGANKRVMITGDTGLGKTTFVKQFAKVLGLPVVIVEIPHVVEEHLINIPFVVFDAKGNSSQGYDQVPKDKVSLQLGTSYLANTLQKLNKLDDAAYQAAVKGYDPFLKTLIDQYENMNPGELASVRKSYSKILFFDEYYRQTSPAIRNILRNVLNNRIGNDVIPPGTYVMYATNLSDVGGSIDAQSQHTSFIHQDYKAPTAEQWLNFTISKALGAKINIKKPVIDAFKNYLTDENISFNDLDNDIRVSPRRWSEIFQYINNAYPFKNPDEVGILIATLQRQFRGEDGTTSSAYNSLKSIIEDLTTSSGLDVKKIKPVSPTRWRDVLRQQVMTAIEVGEQKKYVPVLQGQPGVGKTAIGAMFEKEPYNMRFIPILATTISRDSLTGIPLPDQEQDKMGVDFAPPELFIRIMDMIKESRRDYVAQLKEEEAAGGPSAKARWDEFQNQKYKYLIFFDEINRVSDVSIFNSLRRLILEREFNDKYRLPKESVVIAAMNPDDLGTQPLTSHFRDAVDIIDVSPSWDDTLLFLKNQVVPFLKNTKKGSDASIEIAMNIIEAFEKSFTETSKEFYINIGGVATVYISPRDYDNLFKELVAGLERRLTNLNLQQSRGKEIDDEEIKQSLISAAYGKIEGMLEERFYQAGIGAAPGFMDGVMKMLDDTINVNMKKETKIRGLDKILLEILSKGIELKDDSSMIAYLATYVPTQYADDFYKFCNTYYGDDMDLGEIKRKNQEVLTLYRKIEELAEEKDYGIDIADQTAEAFGNFTEQFVKKSGDTHSKEAGEIARELSNTYIKIG